MKYHSIILLAATSLAACADAPDHAETRTGLEIRTAPLALDHASDACYTLKVYNDALANLASADTVMQLQHICGSQYGFETEISYVAPCDAQGNNGDPDFKPNTVELILENICTGGACNDPAAPSNAIAVSEYVNPCPASLPCRQEIVCRENADVPVTFNLTVMRDADQGFFDIAVNFTDLFCSAKFDCEYSDGATINLLHDCNGERADFTGVLAVACTRGPGAGAALETHVYMDAITISCDDGFSVTLDPTAGPGNVLDPCVGALDANDARTTTVFQHGIYHGIEQLGCDDDDDPNTPDVDCNKVYWNNAIGFTLAQLQGHPGCRVSTTVTASEGSLVNGNTSPTSSYPLLVLDAPLTDDTGVAPYAMTCETHPVGSADFAFDYTNAPTLRREVKPFAYVGYPGASDLVTEDVVISATTEPVIPLALQSGETREVAIEQFGLSKNLGFTPSTLDGYHHTQLIRIDNAAQGGQIDLELEVPDRLLYSFAKGYLGTAALRSKLIGCPPGSEGPGAAGCAVLDDRVLLGAGVCGDIDDCRTLLAANAAKNIGYGDLSRIFAELRIADTDEQKTLSALATNGNYVPHPDGPVLAAAPGCERTCERSDGTEFTVICFQGTCDTCDCPTIIVFDFTKVKVSGG